MYSRQICPLEKPSFNQFLRRLKQSGQKKALPNLYREIYKFFSWHFIVFGEIRKTFLNLLTFARRNSVNRMFE